MPKKRRRRKSKERSCGRELQEKLQEKSCRRAAGEELLGERAAGRKSCREKLQGSSRSLEIMIRA
jgi:hypothetical protein